jgi:activator of HSP90 ATPase
MKTVTIRQSVKLTATPHDVYECLMDSRKHSTFTGCPAKISRKVGGNFTAMESLRGKNVELMPGQKIVQTWQCDYDGWPKNHFSTLTIRLRPTENGTRLDFVQNDVPAVCFTGIREAWLKYYWQPLKKLFRQKDGATASSSEARPAHA